MSGEIDTLRWIHQQSGAFLDMRDGAKELGLMSRNREREELELLIAAAYARGALDALQSESDGTK